jgi:L,D-transpeptidase YcbB
MTKPLLNYFYSVKTYCLLYMFVCGSAQASASWSEQSAHLLEQSLIKNQQQLPELSQPAVVTFYQQRKYKPLWSNEKGRSDRAYDLLQVIIHADDEGLDPADYHLEEIRKYWASTAVKESIYLELLLTAALYRYSNDVYSGRYDPTDLDTNWHIQNKPQDISSLFAEIARKKSIKQVLDALPPRHSGYELLKKALRRYRDIEQQGGWKRFKRGPVLEAGMQDNQVIQLRQRLATAGDLDEAASLDIAIFDRGLVDAVKRFQSRHGLTADGRVGSATRRALNIQVSERIRQIRTNMERWRWLPRKLGKRYLIVNMTGFELYIVDRDTTVLAMPVIIGKAYRSTPSFSGLVSSMEYNPYWTIPTNIAVNDLIPRQMTDPAFFEKKSIKLYQGWKDAREIDPQTVDWQNLDMEHFPYWLRQEPGPENALGRVKFLFSNPYEIYLHGTPDKHLFYRTVRAFSSGCIRVQDPVKLAAYLLNDGTQQMEEEILENIHLGTNQSLILPVSVPIYLVYWTAWVDPDNGVNFRRDIYHRDTRLNNVFGRS